MHTHHHPQTSRRRPFSEGRLAFAQAVDIAAELGHTRLAPAHLLLGLLANARGESHAVLTEAGLTYAAARDAAAELPDDPEPQADTTDEQDEYAADRDALAAIGIDLDKVRAAVRENLGEDIAGGWPGRGGERGRRGRRGHRHGHGPHGRRGRRGPLAGPAVTPALAELLSGLRAEARRQHRRPDPQRLLAGLVALDDPGITAILATAGDPAAVRDRILAGTAD